MTHLGPKRLTLTLVLKARREVRTRPLAWRTFRSAVGTAAVPSGQHCVYGSIAPPSFTGFSDRKTDAFPGGRGPRPFVLAFALPRSSPQNAVTVAGLREPWPFLGITKTVINKRDAACRHSGKTHREMHQTLMEKLR